MDIFATLFFMLFPFIVWVGIVAAIVMAINGNFRRRGRGRTVRNNGRVNPTIQLSGEMRKPAKKTAGRNSGGVERKRFSFGNSGYDTYETKGRKKDFVSGYDRRVAGGENYRRAKGMQYSHTYNGHEPWDKCLPKEKDPWDKDFYA